MLKITLHTYPVCICFHYYYFYCSKQYIFLVKKPNYSSFTFAVCFKVLA